MATLIRELFANQGQTTLSSAITSTTATSVSVTSGAVFPSTGNFRVVVDDEIMLCTANASNTLTVVRGYESTTASTHLTAAPIGLALTVGGLQRYLRNSFHLFDTATPPTGTIQDVSGNELTSSNFTITNAVSATVTDAADGSIVVYVPSSSGGGDNLVTLMRSVPSTPYSIQCAMQFYSCSHASQQFRCGVALGDGSGKFVTSGILTQSSTPIQHTNTTWLTSTTNAGNLNFADSLFCHGLYYWFKITDDGTNLTFFRSYDGQNWVQDFQGPRTYYLTSGPTLVGLFSNNNCTTGSLSAGTTGDTCVTFAHYSEG